MSVARVWAGAAAAVLLCAAAPFGGRMLVGSVTLTSCADVPAYCGSIERPLDPAGQIPGRLSIGFTWRPHADGMVSPAGTILAMEGGPGYPSGASFDAYRALFAPLLQRYDLLLVDDRGTGRSGALRCEPLQSARVMMVQNVARCGRQLGRRADLYGTALAVDDVAAVLDALRVRTVTVYGDSYGTFAAQTFAGRHPDRVAAIVLDGAYPVIGSDPWLSSVAPQIRRAFSIVAPRLPIGALLAALRRPGTPVTPSQLAFVMDSAGLNPLAYRELGAAARAYLGGDRVPLERVVRDTYRYDEQNGSDVRAFSAALFVAASCSDDPQPYDMTLPPALRAVQWQRVLAAKERADPHLYAPFTIGEFLGMPPDYGYVNLCTSWPVASAAHPAREPLLPNPHLPNVPALVLVGNLDTITTPAESAAAARLFPGAHLIVVRNTGHVTAVGDVYRCASAIVVRFVATQQTGDPSCARSIPPPYVVPAFQERLSARFAARDAAIAAARDALARVRANGVIRGRGLRAGTFVASTLGAVTTIALNGVVWTPGLPVFGTVRFDARNGRATLHARLPGGSRVEAAWNEYYPAPSPSRPKA